MSPAEEGGYIRLLCYDWDKDGIPDDDDQLATLSRLGEGWLKGGSIKIKACFEPHPRKTGFLTNARLEKERKKQAVWREKSKLGGIKGSQSRAKARRRVVEPPLEGWLPNGSNQKPTLQSPSPSPSPEVPPVVPQGGLTTGQLIALLQKEISKAYDRDPSIRWSELDEHALMDVCRRHPKADQEWLEIKNYRDTKPKYFPFKIPRLLQDWDGILDSARAAGKPSGKPWENDGYKTDEEVKARMVSEKERTKKAREEMLRNK